MRADIVDLYHEDKEPDFGTLKNQGVKGAILKATEGANEVDDKFAGWFARASGVWGPGMVHAYHMINGDEPKFQVANFLAVTMKAGCTHRWLDYEKPCPKLDIALSCCHILATKQNKWPGMYGSDGDKLGLALLGGHFTVCPLWIARYGPNAPLHRCDLWQFAQADASHVYDSSIYLGRSAMSLSSWMASV